MAVRVLRVQTDSVELPIMDGAGSAREVAGVHNGARYRAMDQVTLPPDGATRVIRYPVESTYYVARGRGLIQDCETSEYAALKTGSMILIPAGVPHIIQSEGDAEMMLVGGPCPPARPL